MRTRIVGFLLLAVFLGGCRQGRNVVVWISIDGFRGDYVDRVDTPSFHRLMREGSYSRKLVPVTPSITFPSHVSQATGVTVAKHGIPNNEFYDTTTNLRHKFPNEAALLQAEAIWMTAKRQGVRTLVYDWPLSHMQTGPVKTDYFREKFENPPSDEERLKRIIDTWRGDKAPNGKPLRLIMGYIKGTDPTGHTHGPDSPQIVEKIAQVDRALGRFIDQVVEVFKSKMSPDDRLYMLLTTDHGMSRVKTLVNVRKLLSRDPPGDVHILTDGPVAMIYLARHRDELSKAMVRDLRRHPFLDVYTRATLPATWGFNHPTRVGDIVIMLKPDFTFSAKSTEMLTPADSNYGSLGMHGFPADQDPGMNGFCVLWCYPSASGGKDLGRVDSLRLHPTVAKLLGVRPGKDAKGKPLRLR